MRRYFFNLYNDVDAIDEEGTELPDLAAAMEHAIEECREMICASVREGHLNLDHRIEVTDEDGTRLLTVPFRDAVAIAED